MKSITWLLLIFCSAVTVVVASDVREIEKRGLSYDEYRAQRIKEHNQSKELPKLDYWGVRGVEWGDAESSVSALSGRSTTFMGKPCTRRFGCDKSTKQLQQVRHDFASTVTNREDRLLVYQSLKTELVKAYNSPTKVVKEDEVFRGKDAYTQGLDKEYSMEWVGPETTVRLLLSDEELFIEFRQSPTSEAPVKKQKVQAAVRHTAEMQKLAEEDQKKLKPKESPQTP